MNNSRGIGVSARIKDTGDGLLVEDTAGGAGLLRITDEGDTTATALRITGTAAAGQTTIDGSYETRITVGGGETLNELAARIKESCAPISVAIINSGGAKPYRLSLTISLTDLRGQLAVDTAGFEWGFDTFVQAKDATVLYGPAELSLPVVIESASSSIEGLRGFKVSNPRRPLSGQPSDGASPCLSLQA